MSIKIDNVCRQRTTCRICGSDELVPVINLGEQCLASVFETSAPPDWLRQKYPLELVRCAASSGCGLVQLGHSITPRLLYRYYGYRSGINERMRQNLLDIARTTEELVPLRKGDTICDIGCNDGTLLKSFTAPGIDRLGIDPAENVVQLARRKGLEVICDFFSRSVYENARPGKKARIVSTVAMFYDLDDPDEFMRDVAAILADNGIWIMELSYLPLMLQHNSFDSICHEHLAYYCLRQLEWLLDQHSLVIHRVSFNDINGGSIRLFIRKQSAGPIPKETASQLAEIRQQERIMGLGCTGPYEAFYQSILTIRHDLQCLLHDLHHQGKTIYAYGASTKGNTILQFCDIDSRLIKKAADRNPDKWSSRTPATNIEIISEQQAREEKPDYFLVLPWSFFNVFKKREAAFLERGGKFVLPLPTVQIVGKNGDVRP